MPSLGLVWNIYHTIGAFREFTGVCVGGDSETGRCFLLSCFLTESDWGKSVETGWWRLSQSTLCSMERWTIGACAYLFSGHCVFSSIFTVTPLRSSGFSGVDCAVLVRPWISALAEVFDIQLHGGERSCLPHGPGYSWRISTFRWCCVKQSGSGSPSHVQMALYNHRCYTLRLA